MSYGLVVIVRPDERVPLEQLGMQRDEHARASGLHHKVKARDTSREYQVHIHIEGAVGEYVVCKRWGVPFPATIDTYRSEPDIPPDVEVRTRSEDWHDLIVRPDDNPDHRCVLVTGSDARYVIRGWIYARDAQRNEWWHEYGDGPGAWWVPQNALQPMWFE